MGIYNQTHKNYNQRNKEKICANKKEYYQKNKEKVKIKSKEWYYKNRKKALETVKKYRLNHPEKCKQHMKHFNLMRKYGISEELYNNMVKNQDGQCLICDLKVERLDVDHNHATGKIRGLLCHNCNSLLGHAKDNIDTLKEAINYLELTNELKGELTNA